MAGYLHCFICNAPGAQKSFSDLPHFYLEAACCFQRFCLDCYGAHISSALLNQVCPACGTAWSWCREALRFPGGMTNTAMELRTGNASSMAGSVHCTTPTCPCREEPAVPTAADRAGYHGLGEASWDESSSQSQAQAQARGGLYGFGPVRQLDHSSSLQHAETQSSGSESPTGNRHDGQGRPQPAAAVLPTQRVRLVRQGSQSTIWTIQQHTASD